MGQYISKLQPKKKSPTRNELAIRYMIMHHVPMELIDWIITMVIEIPHGQSLTVLESMQTVSYTRFHFHCYDKIVMDLRKLNHCIQLRIRICGSCGNIANYRHDAIMQKKLMQIEKIDELFAINAKIRRFCHCHLGDFYEALIEKRVYDDDILAVVFRTYWLFAPHRRLRYAPNDVLGGEPFLWPNGANHYF